MQNCKQQPKASSCFGIIPPIPQLGSHAWDYDLDQTASFFAQKSALEPLHAQYEYLSNRVSVVSDVSGERELTVRAEVYDFESREVWEKEAKVDGEGCPDGAEIRAEAWNGAAADAERVVWNGRGVCRGWSERRTNSII